MHTNRWQRYEEYIATTITSGKYAFTLEEISEALQLPKATARSDMWCLEKDKLIISPALNFYVIIPPQHKNSGCIPAIEVVPLIMAHRGLDYYVGFLTAAAMYSHGKDQKFQSFQIVTNKPVKPLVCGETRIEFITKKSCARFPTQTVTVATGKLKVSSPETTVLDLIENLRHHKDITTIIAKLMIAVNPKKMVALAKKLKALAPIQRLCDVIDNIDTIPSNTKNYITKELNSYLGLYPLTTFEEYINGAITAGKEAFTLDEAAAALQIPKATVHTAVYRLTKRGDLLNPVKGLYIITSAKHKNNEGIPPIDLIRIVMRYLGVEYYIGLGGAAAIHNGRYNNDIPQIPQPLYIITNKKVHKLPAFKTPEFDNTHIQCLHKTSWHHVAIQTTNIGIDTYNMPISSPEVTAMDLVYYTNTEDIPKMTTVLSELMDTIDLDKILTLAQQSETKGWIQRLGYILETITTHQHTKKQRILDILANYLASQNLKYIPFIPHKSYAQCYRSDKWMMIDNIAS